MQLLTCDLCGNGANVNRKAKQNGRTVWLCKSCATTPSERHRATMMLAELSTEDAAYALQALTHRHAGSVIEVVDNIKTINRSKAQR